MKSFEDILFSNSFKTITAENKRKTPALKKVHFHGEFGNILVFT